LCRIKFGKQGNDSSFPYNITVATDPENGSTGIEIGTEKYTNVRNVEMQMRTLHTYKSELAARSSAEAF
jgi:hypothetical protein